MRNQECVLLRQAVLAGVAAVMMMTVSCAPALPSAPKENTRPPMVTPSPTRDTGTATPTVPEPAAATKIPSTCDELLSPRTVQSYDNRLELHSTGHDAESTLAELLGPVTMATLLGGEQQLHCAWGITQTDAFAYLSAAVVSEKAKTELVAALRDSVYVEEGPASAEAVFSQPQSANHHRSDLIIIDGDLLIVLTHSISGSFAWDAYATIQG